MSKDDLYKLRKTELLQIIYEQKKQINNLKDENAKLNQELDNRKIDLKEAGSIAEAALKINKIFENAQKAADEYLSNVKKLNNSKKVTEEKNKKDIIDNKKEQTKNLELIPLNVGLINVKLSLVKKIKIFLSMIFEKIKTLKLKIEKRKIKIFLSTIFEKIKILKPKTEKRKINFDDYNLSLNNIENELKKQKNKDSKIKFAQKSTYYIIIIIAVTIIIVTRIFNVIQISGNSMEPSLFSGDLLVSTKIFGYKKGDIVVFYYNNSILIKRIIATGGDIVNIDDEGDIYVNSEKLEEDYVQELSYGNCDITFPFKVPDKELFVLGDNRKSSIDSRTKAIGTISDDRILGKIIININHLTFY